jgi:hypothetical protein
MPWDKVLGFNFFLLLACDRLRSSRRNQSHRRRAVLIALERKIGRADQHVYRPDFDTMPAGIPHQLRWSVETHPQQLRQPIFH